MRWLDDGSDAYWHGEGALEGSDDGMRLDTSNLVDEWSLEDINRRRGRLVPPCRRTE